MAKDIHSSYSWIEDKVNRNDHKVHRHENYPYWHDPTQDHTKEGSKRSAEEREKVVASPNKRNEEGVKQKEKETQNKKREESNKQSEKDTRRHRNYTLVNHKKFTSLKQKLMNRPYAQSGFKLPKFTPQWCIMAGLTAVARLFDASEALYEKYQKSPMSRAGKILQYKSNGYEDAMDKFDGIYPPDKKDWSFEELQTADKLLTEEMKRIYTEVAEKYNLGDWEAGYQFLNNTNSPEYKKALKENAPYLYRVREEAYTYGQMRANIKNGMKATARYQRGKRSANSVSVSRQQATAKL